jgi:hypothetical protein
MGIDMSREEIGKAAKVAEGFWIVATGTVIGGENLGWMSPAEMHAKMGMMKGMLKPDAVYTFKDAREVADRALVDRTWRKVLAWPATTVMTYHDPPGHAFHGDGRAALERAIRDAGQLAD